ncbi:hypothetical protein PCANC_10411 [Puccinia coronata f. sp. avenae]|uniref:Uncharacterized protein n=1 Tax=Puccinia coronata f. sp. avenae TaxID=200324 RepID=A0A2N5STS9_9BASI|nr:hypothetical protein PCANC_10411 [Puccinia coronata f. sp. avenae]
MVLIEPKPRLPLRNPIALILNCCRLEHGHQFAEKITCASFRVPSLGYGIHLHLRRKTLPKGLYPSDAYTSCEQPGSRITHNWFQMRASKVIRGCNQQHIPVSTSTCRLKHAWLRCSGHMHKTSGEFSTWKPGDDPLKGLELPCMGDVLAAPNHDPLGIWQHNELWWTHDHVGGAESEISNFLTPQHYQTKKSEMTDISPGDAMVESPTLEMNNFWDLEVVPNPSHNQLPIQSQVFQKEGDWRGKEKICKIIQYFNKI